MMMDTTAVMQELQRKYTPYEPVPGNHFQAAFGHLAFDPAVPDAIGRLADALGAEGDLADHVAGLVERLGLPTHLGDCGVTDEDLDAVARLSQGNGNVAANPRPVSEADARALLEAAA